MFDLEKENKNISNLCDYIDRMNALNPLNPGGISDMAYHNVMTNLHNLVDLDEPIDQDYPYGEWDLIEQHNHNFAECLEYDQMQTLQEAFPEGY
jgi:hypothetical protein